MSEVEESVFEEPVPEVLEEAVVGKRLPRPTVFEKPLNEIHPQRLRALREHYLRSWQNMGEREARAQANLDMSWWVQVGKPPVCPCCMIDVPGRTDATDHVWHLLEVAARGRSATKADVERWVAEHLITPVQCIDKDTVPSTEALALLKWAQGHPGDFHKPRLTKSSPVKPVVETDGGDKSMRTEDGEDLNAILDGMLGGSSEAAE